MHFLSDGIRAIGRVLESKGFKFIGSGRQRATFLTPSGKYVLKIPRDDSEGDAEEANRSEAHAYISGCLPFPVAKCRLIRYLGKDCILMEKVDTSPDYKRSENKWVNKVDIYQVGYTRKGQLVAYDYTLDYHIECGHC
jgi:hypothetical protein